MLVSAMSVRQCSIDVASLKPSNTANSIFQGRLAFQYPLRVVPSHDFFRVSQQRSHKSGRKAPLQAAAWRTYAGTLKAITAISDKGAEPISIPQIIYDSTHRKIHGVKAAAVVRRVRLQ